MGGGEAPLGKRRRVGRQMVVVFALSWCCCRIVVVAVAFFGCLILL